MARRVEQPTADILWPALLECKRLVDQASPESADGILLFESGGRWDASAASGDPDGIQSGCTTTVFARLDADTPTPGNATHEFCQSRFRHGEEPLRSCDGSQLFPQIEAVLRIYLPLILGGWHAKRRGQAFVSAHIAQTLDGRIACNNGHSQWISNEANLWHAHRLRALHDAVLVGGQTVATDDPQLTVRHVEGHNPTRVILSGSAKVLALAGERQIFEDPGCLVVCGTDALTDFTANGVHQHTRVCGIPSSGSSPFPAATIIEALATHGIHSIFVEGGSMTCSSFLEQSMIDVLHVHVASMILGSGIPSFVLPEVTNIRSSRHLRMQHFEMDNELLFECRLGGME
ncbi:MAG: RibD family protein [Planctomycetota bacterium]|nr:RibD family protein [Planctomycetota bacterium]